MMTSNTAENAEKGNLVINRGKFIRDFDNHMQSIIESYKSLIKRSYVDEAVRIHDELQANAAAESIVS